MRRKEVSLGKDGKGPGHTFFMTIASKKGKEGGAGEKGHG